MLALVTIEIFCNWLYILYTGNICTRNNSYLSQVRPLVTKYAKQSCMNKKQSCTYVVSIQTFTRNYSCCVRNCAKFCSMEKCHSKGAFDWSALNALDPGP